jgi:hypothetical protein
VAELNIRQGEVVAAQKRLARKLSLGNVEIAVQNPGRLLERVGVLERRWRADDLSENRPGEIERNIDL